MLRNQHEEYSWGKSLAVVEQYVRGMGKNSWSFGKRT